jgi:hypothetical protein
MKLASLLLALLAWQTVPTPAPVDRLAALPPRAKVAGLAGLQTTSQVRFAEEGARPHVLEATFLFPDRARWTLAPEGAKPGERHIVYRCGEAFFELSAESASARLVSDVGKEDPQWRASFAAVEARRALFLWPEGFEWQRDGERQIARLRSGEALTVELGPDGLPRSLEVTAERTGRERFDELVWSESRGRRTPASFTFRVDGELVWHEVVASCETRVQALDSFFLPAELRPGAAAAEAGPRPTHIDIPRTHSLRVELPAATGWDKVRELWQQAFTPYARPAPEGWRLEGGSCVEVDEQGAPRAIVLRFKPGVGGPPSGVTTAREHGALALALAPASGALSESLARLRAALPHGARPGVAFARFPAAPTPDSGPFQLFLPIESEP